MSQIVEIKVSYYMYLLHDRRIRIWKAQKHVDPVDPDSDPDPEHCQQYISITTLNILGNS